MATSHQYHSQNNVVNGANGERGINGGNDYPQPQPSTSGEQDVEPVASLQSLCFRALFLCCDLLQKLVLRLPDRQTLDVICGRVNDADHSTAWAIAAARSEQEVEPVLSLQSLCLRALFLCCDLLQGLRVYISRELRITYYQNLDVIYGHLNDAGQYTAWALAAGRKPQPEKWYFFVPVRLFQMITSTGAALIERYLDKQLPENQYLVNWLREIPASFIGYEKEAYRLLGYDVDSESEDACKDFRKHWLEVDVRQRVASERANGMGPTSSANQRASSSRKLNQENVQLLPSSYAYVGPVPSPTSSESNLIIDEEHESQEAEDEQPATEAVAAGGPSVSTDQPQQQLSAAAPGVCLVSAQEAEQAAMGAPRTPPAQPASSQHCLAAVGPSQPSPGSIRTECKPAKSSRFLNFLGFKKA